MIALIDGDLVVYQNAFRAEDVIDFGDGELLSHASLSKAVAGLEDHVHRIAEAADCDRVVVALSDADRSRNFRRQVYPDYKRPRGVVKRPLCYKALREELSNIFEVVERPCLEADDVLGIIATHPRLRKWPDRKVICSIDKDLATIPGFLYNWERPEHGVRRISEFDADREFFIQTLVGDRTDNYPGCPGIGRIRAERLLPATPPYPEAPPPEVYWWQQVVEAFAKKGLSEADALVQARCARILRASDYDFKKGEVKLWEPSR